MIITTLKKDIYANVFIALSLGIAAGGMSYLLSHLNEQPLALYQNAVQYIPLGALIGLTAKSFLDGLKERRRHD
jgi:hypothetical protein